MSIFFWSTKAEAEAKADSVDDTVATAVDDKPTALSEAPEAKADGESFLFFFC